MTVIASVAKQSSVLTLTLTENEGFSPELVYLGEANLSMKGRVYAPFRLNMNLILMILILILKNLTLTLKDLT
jgi:hypothetical protein